MEENRYEPKLLNDQKISDPSEQYEVDVSDNFAHGDGFLFFLLEADALSDLVGTNSSGFGMFDTHLTYFDADKNNIT